MAVWLKPKVCTASNELLFDTFVLTKVHLLQLMAVYRSRVDTSDDERIFVDYERGQPIKGRLLVKFIIIIIVLHVCYGDASAWENDGTSTSWQHTDGNI